MQLVDIQTILNGLNEEANRGCGLVYELYVQRFSDAVDSFFSDKDEAVRSEAFKLAKQMDYQTQEERDDISSDSAANGLCCHFLDAQTCPCGCFEDE